MKSREGVYEATEVVMRNSKIVKRTIGTWRALGILALVLGAGGCHSAQTAPPPPPQVNGIPAEASQRMQQMSPQMRAQFQQKMEGAIPQGAKQTPPAGGTSTGG